MHPPEPSPGSPNRVRCRGWWIHGTKGWSTELVERLVEEALKGNLINGGPTIMCDTIVRCHPLIDPTSLVATWRERLAVYPEVLRRNVIVEGLWELVTRGRQVQRAILREDYPFSIMGQSAIIERVLQVIYAVNRAWYPSPKRQRERLLQLGLLPEDIHVDLDKLGSRGTERADHRFISDDLRNVLSKVFCWVGDNCRDIPVNLQWLEILGSNEGTSDNPPLRPAPEPHNS